MPINKNMQIYYMITPTSTASTRVGARCCTTEQFTVRSKNKVIDGNLPCNSVQWKKVAQVEGHSSFYVAKLKVTNKDSNAISIMRTFYNGAGELQCHS